LGLGGAEETGFLMGWPPNMMLVRKLQETKKGPRTEKKLLNSGALPMFNALSQKWMASPRGGPKKTPRWDLTIEGFPDYSAQLCLEIDGSRLRALKLVFDNGIAKACELSSVWIRRLGAGSHRRNQIVNDSLLFGGERLRGFLPRRV